jgi:carbon-monoxide dehydrogenase iron sulfur subunit
MWVVNGNRFPHYINGDAMKLVYVNEEVCIGCGLCEVYCRLEHSFSKDLIKSFKKEPLHPAPLLRVERREPISFAVTCRHCTEPHCIYACITGALQRKPESGIVTVDEGKCTGCWTCILACPYGVIRQEKHRGKITKCDLCFEKEIPACVANCPNEALTYAEIQDEAII